MMRKTLFREIRGSLGRYLAILAIIALGTGCFAGLRVCKQTMLNAANDYIVSQKLFDYRLVSTLGYDDEDVEAISSIEGVEAVSGAISKDVLVRTQYTTRVQNDSDSEIVLKALSITDGINEPDVQAGRLPQSANECLADALIFDEEALGTKISLSADNDQDTQDYFSYDDYTIVGLVSSPLYLNYERGTTSLGDGVVSAYFYIEKAGFSCDYFTEIYLTLDKTAGLFIYSDKYKDTVEDMKNTITAVAETAADRRYNAIIVEANSQLADAQAEYNDALSDYQDKRAEAEQALDESWQTLEDARAEIDDGQTKIADGWTQLKSETEKSRQALMDAEATLAEAKTKLDDGEVKYSDGLAEYLDGLTQYQEGKQKYDEGLAEYNDGLEQYQKSLEDYNDFKKQLSSADMSLASGGAQLSGYETQYNDLLNLYNGVAAIANYSGADTDPGAYIQGLKEQIFAADNGDPGAIATVEALDVALEGYGFESSRALIDTWDQAEAAILSTGYGTALDSDTLTAMRAALDQGQASYTQGHIELKQAQAKLDEAKAQLDEAKATLDDSWLELEDARLVLEDTETQLTAAKTALEDSRAELDSSWQAYYDGLGETEEGWNTLDRVTAETQSELYQAENDLAKGISDYDDGLAEYNDAKAEAEQAFADAESKLSDAQLELESARQEIDTIEYPSIFTLTRDSSIGYVCLKSDAEIVHGISTVFPLFFLIVAALVCITTMTRMVEEQRIQIGISKALGYGNGFIISKYLLYSGSASLIGCVAGFLVGSYFIPRVIWETYKIMYNFGNISFYLDIKLAMICILVYLFCAMAATWISCRTELMEVPAELIRPKAPKSGKRVLLERVPFIWRRLGFLSKVSIRNIFRYKQRLIMMIIGICGCTALLLTGYGIRDSISNVIYYQYDEINVYDCLVSLSETHDSQWVQELADSGGGVVEDILAIHEGAMDMEAEGKEKSVSVIVPDGDISPFVDLHRDDKPVAYPTKGEAVICISLAESFGLKVGDTIELRDVDMNALSLTVSDICDNYIYNYVYISKDTCVDQWGWVPDMKTVFVNFTEGTDPNSAAAKLIGHDDVTFVEVSSAIKERMSGSLSSMDSIVLLVIVCAAALAFIVLYNLTNISLTERKREIATIKVLGFYPVQSAVYVFRENLVLTAVGALCGLGVGVFMHRFVMSKIKLDMVYFDARIAPKSYFIAIMLTLIFAIIVDFVMYPRIEKINMTEALKSIE